VANSDAFTELFAYDFPVLNAFDVICVNRIETNCYIFENPFLIKLSGHKKNVRNLLKLSLTDGFGIILL